MPSPAHPEAASPAETRRDRLLRRDRAATQAVARLPHPRWLTAPYGALSLSANYGLLWFVIAAVPWISGASHGARTFVFIAGSVLVTEWITYGLKLIVGRRRPALVDPTLGGHIPLPRSHSFPSSHASMGMAGLLTMSSLYPVWLPALALLTALLCFSRVYLGVHYLLDVLAGVSLGSVLGVVFVLLFRALT
jgi:membrane-associated phospholipid phosphatase